MLRSGSPAALCDPNTVFVTIPSLSTITIYQASPDTVYVTLPCSSKIEHVTPTTTLTLHSTLSTTAYPQVDTVYLTTPVRASLHLLPENAATTKAPHYVATVTETTVLVITNVQLTPYQSGGSLIYSETAAPNGLLLYVVENGTTYWLNGKTPAPSESYVVLTSVVTVEPVPESSHTSDETSTVHLTRYSTQSFTVTETLSTPSASKTASSHQPQLTQITQVLSTPCSTAVETGSSFTGIGAGGWNSTSTTRSGYQTGFQTAAMGSPSTLSLMPLDPSQPVSLDTTYSIRSLNTMEAQSGFNAFSTSSAGDSTSSNGGAYTSTPVAPYANTTWVSPTSSSPVLSSVATSALGTAVSTSAASSLPSGSSSITTASSATASSSLFSSYLSTSPTAISNNQTSTSVSSTASGATSNCGEYGDFTLTVRNICLFVTSHCQQQR